MSPNINYNQTDIYRRLKDEKGIFESYTRLFLFFATVGYSEGKKLEPEYGDEEIRWEFLTKYPSWEIVVQSIAYADTGDKEVLFDEDRQREIILQYAQGGAEIIEDVVNQPDDDIENLIEYLEENRNEQQYGEESGILGKIEEEINTLPR
jgi:dnd system-associated protein 4